MAIDDLSADFPDRYQNGDVYSERLRTLRAQHDRLSPVSEPTTYTVIEKRFEAEGLLRRDPGFFDVAERYLERRHKLEPIASTTLAEKIARPMMERLGVTGVEPDRFLEQAAAFKRSKD